MAEWWKALTWAQIGIQLIGCVAMAMVAVSFQARTRRRILLLQLGSSALWTTHFVLLQAPLGAVMNAVGILRCLVFAAGDSRGFCRSPWMLGGVCALYIACGVGFYATPLDILPIVGSVIGTLALFCTDPQKLRLIFFFSSPPWLIYDAFAGSIPGVGCETFNLTSIVIALFRFRRRPSGTAAPEAVTPPAATPAAPETSAPAASAEPAANDNPPRV